MYNAKTGLVVDPLEYSSLYSIVYEVLVLRVKPSNPPIVENPYSLRPSRKLKFEVLNALAESRETLSDTLYPWIYDPSKYEMLS